MAIAGDQSAFIRRSYVNENESHSQLFTHNSQVVSKMCIFDMRMRSMCVFGFFV